MEIKEPKIKKTRKIQTTTNGLFPALLALQSEDISIPKRGTGNINGKSYRYATLDDTLLGIKPFLQKYKLIITQTMDNSNLTTKLIHVPSDEVICSTLPLGNPSTSQELGSRITYLRRYQITALLGLVLEEDADGVQNAPDKTPIVPAQPVVTPQNGETESYTKALQTLKNCLSVEALHLIHARIDKSVKLTDTEKELLKAHVEEKEQELKK